LFTQQVPEPVVAGAAIARGRVYFVSSDALYAIGPKTTAAKPWRPERQVMEVGQGAPAWVQVTPTELVLKPGDSVPMHARLFDSAGRFLREDGQPVARRSWGSSERWEVDGWAGGGQAGLIKASVSGLTGEARARVIPPLGWDETFESYAVGSVPPHWVSATTLGRLQISELDGQKVIEKVPTDTLFKRMRVFMGPANWSDYTVEADIRVIEKRRQMGDAGLSPSVTGCIWQQSAWR
jgi:hypothetical protein